MKCPFCFLPPLDKVFSVLPAVAGSNGHSENVRRAFPFSIFRALTIHTAESWNISYNDLHVTRPARFYTGCLAPQSTFHDHCSQAIGLAERSLPESRPSRGSSPPSLTPSYSASATGSHTALHARLWSLCTALKAAASLIICAASPRKPIVRDSMSIRMNQRTCGGTEHLTPTLYNSGLSQDYRAIVHELARVDGLNRIWLVGYSMGGNLILKAAGEAGSSETALAGAIAVCPNIDPPKCVEALEQPRNWVYHRHFLVELESTTAPKGRALPRQVGSQGTRWHRQDERIRPPLHGPGRRICQRSRLLRSCRRMPCARFYRRPHAHHHGTR